MPLLRMYKRAGTTFDTNAESQVMITISWVIGTDYGADFTVFWKMEVAFKIYFPLKKQRFYKRISQVTTIQESCHLLGKYDPLLYHYFQSFSGKMISIPEKFGGTVYIALDCICQKQFAFLMSLCRLGVAKWWGTYTKNSNAFTMSFLSIFLPFGIWHSHWTPALLYGIFGSG